MQNVELESDQAFVSSCWFTGNKEIEEHVINVIMRCSQYKLCRTVDLISSKSTLKKKRGGEGGEPTDGETEEMELPFTT